MPRDRESTPQRDTEPAPRGLDALFQPRAVAVIGASRRHDSIGRVILANLVSGGFEGKVFPVNPNVEVLHSIKCHPSVEAIPDPVDLAVVAIPKQHVEGALQSCARKGVGAVVIITAGFKETGPEGAEVEARLTALAHEHGMRLVGPNCMGIQNASTRVSMNASFSRSFPEPGPVAFVSQSGAMGEAILAHAERIHLGVRMFVSMGNRADVSAKDLLEYWAAEDDIRCILLYLESFGDPREFVPVARRVSRSKAIVTVKAGRSRAGALAATSHTGSLAGADVVADVILRDCGVLRVRSVEELFDVALALAQLPLPDGPRVAVLTNAGGPAILATDALSVAGLEMAPLRDKTRAKLAEQLVPEASLRNPVDMTAGATEADYGHSLRLLLRDKTVDMVLVIFVPPITHDAVAVARAVFDEARRSKKPVVGCFMSRDEVLDTIARETTQDWVPVYLYPESAARALSALVERKRLLERDEGTVQSFPVARDEALAALRPGWLDVERCTTLAHAYGLPLVEGRIATSVDEAVAIAEELGFPCVLKTADPEVVHKTDVGGVLLDLEDASAVREAFRRLTRQAASRVQVQPMLDGAREVVVGFKTDPAFGPILMFGLGGIHVEVLGDVAFAACPVSDTRARQLLRDVNGYPILRGRRGHRGVDEDALVEVIQRVSQLACELPQVVELEMNPLLAFEDGVYAVDLRARVD